MSKLTRVAILFIFCLILSTLDIMAHYVFFHYKTTALEIIEGILLFNTIHAAIKFIPTFLIFIFLKYIEVNLSLFTTNKIKVNFTYLAISYFFVTLIQYSIQDRYFYPNEKLLVTTSICVFMIFLGWQVLSKMSFFSKLNF
jgi:hypothetical protein